MTNGIDFWRILKWVLIVLIAGFIGQFGKMFAKHIIEKVRAKKAKPLSVTDKQEIVTETGDNKDLSPKITEDIPPEQVKERAKQEKKALKALAKQKKKELKLKKP